MKKLALAVLLASTALSASAEEGKDFFARLNAGYAIGQKVKFNGGSKISLGNSPVIGIEGGAMVHEYVTVGLSLDYFTGFEFKAINAFQAAAPENLKVSGSNPKIKVLNPMLNLYITPADLNGFKPYLLIGAGMSFAKADSYNYTFTNTSTNVTGTLKSGASDTVNKFAYKLGAGFKYSVNEDFDVNLHYSYTNLGKIFDENLTDKALTANVIMAGFSYKF